MYVCAIYWLEMPITLAALSSEQVARKADLGCAPAFCPPHAMPVIDLECRPDNTYMENETVSIKQTRMEKRGTK